jgi:CSLREA domain-containing protein
MALEGRALLSTISVNSTADDGSAGTLRWAIGQANADNQADTIVFSSLFNSPRTIALTSGQLTLTDKQTMTITGPGSDLLTISGSPHSRVFQVDSGAAAALSGLTITGGSADRGGGLLNSGGTLALTNCTVTGNSASFGGGGLLSSGGTTTLTDCAVSSNSANYGGGLYNAGGTTTLTGATVSGNSATNAGGGLFNKDGTTTLTNATVSGNSANTGGGLFTYKGGTTTLTNATVSGNSAYSAAGLYTSGGTSTLTNTIVAGNTGSTGIGGPLDPASTHNLIGGNPLLAPLGDYGGPTPTMALLPGSPAFGGGTATGAPTTDQRGLPRSGRVDIGAFQSQGFTLTPGPGSTPQAAVVGTAFAHPLAVTVTAANPAEPVDGGIISFAAPAAGPSSMLSAATVVIASGQASVTATANTTVGAYTATGTVAGVGVVDFSLTNVSLVVTTTLDDTDDTDGVTSLREAIANADAVPGSNTITFDPAVFGTTAQIITLTLGPLSLADSATTTITGPGTDLLTISGSPHSRVFQVNSGAAAALSGLTITGGSADRGGGLLNSGGTLALTNYIVSGNSASFGGGGLLSSGGTTTLTDCTVSRNSAKYGGGLYNAGGTTTLTGATVSGNSATNAGGGLFNKDGTTTLTNATVSGNSAYSGGGLFTYKGGTTTLTNVTVSGNSAYSGAGLSTSSGTTTLTNTIVAGNTGNTGIGGPLDPASTHNLIGGNPLLAPLGDYGGPTQTYAPLPGSPALGGGTATGAPTTDQRGLPRSGRVDIGAFQSQGFTLTPAVGSSPQTTLVGTAFANPLAVSVTAVNPAEPVEGGVISFAVAPATGGASAALSAVTAVITGGQATVTATANATPGRYTASATASAFFTPIDLVLTNASFVVTTAQDNTNETDGVTSLREAIAYANALPGPNTITFDPAVFGTTPQTIVLTGSVLELNAAATTTIQGPGADLLTVSGNDASGVFEIEGGSAALSGLTVTGGKADTGGGLANFGTLVLTNCIVSGNAANKLGGGLYNGGTATLSNCTVSGNNAQLRLGGGLYNHAGGTLSLTNCTVSGNTANVAGGLYNGGAATLTNCTVSGNSAAILGGGLFIFGVTITLTNTIVAGNPGGDVHGALDPASAHNLVGDGTGMTGIGNGSQGNQVGTAQAPIDPLLSAPGDYGGPTPTMALLPASPALGGGGTGPGIPTADQRGQPRIGHADIGAFQSQGSAVAVNDTADGVGSAPGRITLRQAVNLANVLTAAETITFDASVFGTTPQTITLTGGQIRLTNKLTTTITGPSASLLTVSGNSASGNASRVFDIQGGSAALSGLTITGGQDDFGGGLENYRGTLSLTNCTISGNSAAGNGGGLYDLGGTLSLTSCTVSGNSASTVGGGLRNNDGTLSLTNCTISGNSALSGGGLFNSGTLSLTNCTVSGNSATTGGGLANSSDQASMT